MNINTKLIYIIILLLNYGRTSCLSAVSLLFVERTNTVQGADLSNHIKIGFSASFFSPKGYNLTDSRKKVNLTDAAPLRGAQI